MKIKNRTQEKFNFKNEIDMKTKSLKLTEAQFKLKVLRQTVIVFMITALLLFSLLNANAANYYWVGNSGNWDDFSNHWATSSGGTVFHTQPPTQNDDVYFDFNSFTIPNCTITFTNPAQCLNFYGFPNFNPSMPLSGGPLPYLTVFGSFICPLPFDIQFPMQFFNMSPGTFDLETGMNQFQIQLYNPNGPSTYNLLSDFRGCLSIVSAKLNTNNYNLFLSCNGFYIAQNAEVNFGTSTATNSGLSAPELLGLNIDNTSIVNASQATINVTGDFIHTAGGTPLNIKSLTAGNIKCVGDTIGDATVTSDYFNGGQNVISKLSFINTNYPVLTDSLTSVSDNTIDTLEFSGNGIIDPFSGNRNYINHVITSSGAEIKFGSSDTTHISTFSNYADPITFSSSQAGQPSFLMFTAGQCFNAASIQDISASGTGSFYAGAAGVDLGGNTGWQFTACVPPVAYYWVGGSGSWSDVSHWATTSGGTTFHSQPPGPNDDVYFDANSFTASGQIVSITPSAECKNFDAQSVGINTNFVHNNSISVSGSFLLSPNVTWSGNGSLFFKNGGGANTVSTPNNSLGGSSIFFQSQSSSWNVLTDLSTTGTINVDSGIVTFNNIVVNANELRINTLTGITDSVKVFLGTSNFILSSLYFVNTPPAGNVFIDGSNATIVVSGPNPTFTTTPAHYHYIECAGEFNSFGNGSTIVDSLIVNSANAANLISDYVKITGTPFALPCGILSNIGNPIIKKLELASQAPMNMLANHLFVDTLTMSNPTGVLNFLSNDTVTVNHQITSASFAGNLFTIQNTAGTTYFDFAMQQPVCIDYLNLQNINAINNNSVYAGSNSNNLGGNTGWNFATCPPQPVSYYWVGGTGNWSDVSHWATTSGGTTFHTQPPTANDDVYFDANSFSASLQTITFSTSIAQCKNFDWNTLNNIIWNLPSSTELHVNGSFSVAGTTQLNVTDSLNIYFEGSGNNTINIPDFPRHTAGLNVNFFFTNSGTYNALSDMITYGSFRFQSGTFNTNNYLLFSEGHVAVIFIDAPPSANNYPALDFYNKLILDSGFVLNPGNSILYSKVLIVDSNAVFNSTNEDIRAGVILANGTTFNSKLKIGRIFLGEDNFINNIEYGNYPGTSGSEFDGINNQVNNFNYLADQSGVGGSVYIGNASTITSPNTFVHIKHTQIGFQTSSPTIGSMYFSGHSVIDTLIGDYNTQIVLQALDTSVFIRNLLYAQPDPALISPLASYPFSIYSSTASPAFLKLNNDTVCTNNILFNNIAITGANVLYAGYNGIDGGGNFGINFSPCGIQSPVWPGDANYDLIVNNQDVLNIGLAYNETGPVRSGASLAYTAQPATDWNGYFQTAVNHKHADTNGDGLVDDDDTTAISLNYGLTHPARMGNVQNNNSPTDPYLYVEVNPDSVNLSDTVYIETFYGTAQTPVDSVYGIAFTINYDTTLVDTSWINTQFPVSWLGTPGTDLITFSKSFPLQQKIDIALVRTDHNNTSGFGGPICRTGIVIVDNVAGRMPLPITLSNPYALTAFEYVLGVNVGNDTVMVDTTALGMNEFVMQQFTIAPNPAKDLVLLKNIPAQAIVTIYNAHGATVFEKKANGLPVVIDTRYYSKGVYSIRVNHNKKLAIGKLVKL